MSAFGAAPAGDDERFGESASLDSGRLVGDLDAGLAFFSPVSVQGRVNHAVGQILNATGIRARLGEICELRTPNRPTLLAEVVGFSRQTTLLTPLGDVAGLSPETTVVPSGREHVFPVGEALFGRVLDGLGQPLDERGPVQATAWVSTQQEPPNPLARRMIDKPFATGVRVIDSLMTLGEGQRVGIFAPSGVGKSTLLGMIARGAKADVNVIALVGERGREVREFIEHSLSPEVRARSILVVSTSDRPAMERVKSALVATAIAEHFRDAGKRVLLLVDSLTRFARAQREVGLASGEPPTRRSFPPSTFAVLPRLLERAGQGANGSITALYTVLVEGDEESDPIAEEVRSILDGHIVLSRKIALANRYPAIDVLASLSRVMPLVTSPVHQRAAGRLRELLAKYQEIELLVQIGEYREGSDRLGDLALHAREPLMAFCTQAATENVGFDAMLARLIRLANDHV
ncbi:type III secretion system ATPase SctN [Trinickia caryophylli]|uniref:Type 3 secretion system ATPase n=1 Tax=Trinickia caryophylli TaxID=28094 RepID=A0A1X7FKR2_TRICW|nr:type III secretion system ATPase SctN [Trinickia caryophylli]PMS13170.1 EscN/YscN/HrcN family type III secretion system ATPase [Trinickia caryophylli]TRX19302.1 EscN/YscN/HrcN family type III secretion system ATPase [Trinickia caryophylli]WQE13396.1 type III secretion system ATPase SctN [Trinickia caryophylli]SMF53470.1 ATP synthase in type III secretion protein N [Trinickia caryophylli]GLU34085.1 EscN/YscN/HrcN family type III secretion system ATPase [Trinickia caryophylli]